MKVLNNEEEIQYVFHLSDIHIRLYHRLDDEYEHVFRQMYDLLGESKKINEKCLIVLTGDILHNKNDLSPECILTTLRFLNTLSSYYPTLFIAGNHDTLLNNLNRIDSLSAILAENKNTNLHYLRYSGWYRYGDLVFGVSSLLDNKMTLANEIECAGLKKIALYHGGVGKFSTNKGFVMEGIPMSTFDGYDMVMLGDIHLHQYLDKHKRIAYPGSMIAQNFGETDANHGVLKWHTQTASSSLIVLDNPYRYCEATLKDNSLFMDDRTQHIDENVFIPEKCRLKVKIMGSKKPEDIQNIAFIRNKYPLAQIQESVSSPTKNQEQQEGKETTNHNFLKIIHDYFSSLPPDWKDKDKILEIVLTYFKDNLQSKTDASHFEILYVEFDYMFGYGPKNKIDFSKFQKHQTIGIFGMNSAGKSTLIEVVLFLLYGCITRYKHSHSVPPEVVHFQKKKSSGTIRFRSHNIIYEIQKKMSRASNAKIKVDEKLFKILPDGTKMDLSEEHRKKTDKFVISQIGTPVQFLFTNVFLQTNEQSFRSLTPKDRKDFLYDILELSQLEEQYQKTFSQWKENKGVLDQLEKDLKLLVFSPEQVILVRKQLVQLKEERSVCENELALIQKQIREKLSEKQMCPMSLPEIEKNEKIVLDNMMNIEHEQQTLRQLSLEHESNGVQAINPDILETTRKELWETIEILYKKIKKNPSMDPSDFQFETRHEYMPIEEDTASFRQDIYDLLIEEYNNNKKSQETLHDETELVLQKEKLLSSLYPEPDIEDELFSKLEGKMDALKQKITTTITDVKTELTSQTEKLFSLEKELSTLEENWQHKWDEWDEIQKEPDTVKFVSKIMFNEKCGTCCQNQSVLHTCLEESERFTRKKTKLWEETSPSMERNDRLKKQIQELRRSVMDLHKQEQICCQITKIQHIIDNRTIRKRIHHVQEEINRSRRAREERQCILKMKQVWEKTQKIFEERQKTDEHNRKIENKILKNKKKIDVLDQQRKLLDEITHTQSRLKEIFLVLEKEQKNMKELEQWKDNLQRNTKIDEWVAEKEKEETQLKSRLALNIDNYIHKQQENDVLQQQVQAKQIKEETYKKVKAENELLSHLLHILHRDGLPMFFLEQHLPMIEDRINDLIAPFLKQKKIVLRKEQKKETVNILLSVSTLGAETNYLGGMEGFIVDASIKEVLAEISLQCKSNLFIIDEGISALDKKNMENLDQFFHFLEERHPHVFIISHLNEAQNIVRHSLQIFKEGDYSKIECV